MKILGTFLIPSRGTVVTCAPDPPITMDDISSTKGKGGVRLIRLRDRHAWTVIGTETRCVPPQSGQVIGLLLRGTCDLAEGDDVDVERG